MKITLYHSPIACSMVPFVALEEADAEFEVRVVNVLKGEQQRPEFLILNPKHKVPLLCVDDDCLSENVAILQWIARKFPEAQLLPSGEDEFRAISLIGWCSSGIHPALTPNVLPGRYCDLPGSEESVRNCAQKILHENLRIMETTLAAREWFFGSFTIPDAYFFWCLRRIQQFEIDVTSYPNCMAHFARVSARPSVQRVLQFEAQYLAAQAAGT